MIHLIDQKRVFVSQRCVAAGARKHIGDLMPALASLRLGRVVLHLVAMLRDGAYRFHAAGIVRELARR
jgi:hypothetical protein